VSKISFKGVIIGGITDIVSTNIVTAPLLLYIMVPLVRAKVPHEKLMEATMNAIRDNHFYYALMAFLGGSCSLLGGYISARIAKHDEILNGTLAAWLCVGSGIYGMITQYSSGPLWEHLASLIFSPLLAAFGGYLRLRQSARIPKVVV
jgi:hypothetical protein